MRYLRTVVVVLGIIWAASCSSTSNTTTTPQPTRNTDKFSVSTEDGSGTFTPALNIQESGTTTTVTVKAQDANDLSEAFLHLNYDATQYTPTEVTFGDFLGVEQQVLTLALTQVSGDVQIGAAQIANSGAVPQDGVGVLATVTFEKTPFVGGHAVSTFPDGDANKVDDLVLKNQVGNTADLEWTEKNKGDYNNNGIVGISDLSPIALYFGQQVSATSNPIHAGMIDGDKNGEVNIADLSPIGGNLDNQITGYDIYTDAAGTVMHLLVSRPASPDPKVPVKYVQQITISGGEQFTVRPVGTAPSETGVESNVAAPVASEPGEPAAPTNLQATVGASVGAMKVQLNWTASTSTDKLEYIVERKLSSDPDTSFAEIIRVPASQPSYLDSIGLTDADYDYRVWTVDNESLTSLAASNVATGHPYVLVVTPPANLAAQTGAGAASVDLSWDPITDFNVQTINIYRKGPGEGTFTLIDSVPKAAGNTYPDGNGLTEFEEYEYYITAVDFSSSESAASNTALADASAALILSVDSLTTDKTTHYKNGTEPASNITAVANTPAATWTWTATQGAVTGTGDSVTWKPGAGATVEKVTITATAHFGAQTASMDIFMYVTDLTLKTFHDDRGGGGPIQLGTPAGSGHTSPLTLTPFQYLAPLNVNPSKTITTYTGTLAQFSAGKVLLLDRWELWCGPCKAEFPDLDDYAESYEPFGYIQVSLSNDSSPSYSCAQIANWFGSNGIEWAHQFFDDGSDNGMNAFWDSMGYDYYIPYNVLVDRDGYVRKTGGQAFGWDVDIAQLCGVPTI